MKTRDIVKVIGAGDHIHIGTEHGSGWLFTGAFIGFVPQEVGL